MTASILYRPKVYLVDVGQPQPKWWKILCSTAAAFGVRFNRVVIDEKRTPLQRLHVLLPPNVSSEIEIYPWSPRSDQRAFACAARRLSPSRNRFLLYLPCGEANITIDEADVGMTVVSSLPDFLQACCQAPPPITLGDLDKIIRTDLQRVGSQLSHDLRAKGFNRDCASLRKRAIAYVKLANVASAGQGLNLDDVDSVSLPDLAEIVDSLITRGMLK